MEFVGAASASRIFRAMAVGCRAVCHDSRNGGNEVDGTDWSRARARGIVRGCAQNTG